MHRKTQTFEHWSSEKSRELYGIRNWGGGYFDISKNGDVLIRPGGRDGKATVSMMEIISGIEERGLSMPVLLRLEGILDSRIRQLHESFAKAIKTSGYQSVYRGVYPIKVNQQEQVVSEVARFGKQYHHGLEAGSKPELIAAISLIDDPEAFVICNGYKDEEFVDLALHATRMGIQCVLVVETMSELDLILTRSKIQGVDPILGVRIKLSSQAGGRWTESGGDRSVFGLNTAQVIDMVDVLREKKMLNCLQLLHCHVGSQIPNIRDIRGAVSEAARIYAGLVQEGAAMGIIDLGGGLAVDYDGSHTNFSASSNYTIDEYTADVVEQIMAPLDETGIPHPVLVTESGRATVAYYSVLLFNILDVSKMETHCPPEKLGDDHHEITKSLFELPGNMTLKNTQESYHDAIYYRDEIRHLFRHGAISLRERALAEQVFWHIMTQVLKFMGKMKYVPDELEGLESRLADVYYGNLSVFQSLPDAWAIDQLFPVMPVHRLLEAPSQNAIISDITCDCDGKLDRFVELQDVSHTLPLHPLLPDQEYYLGVFLVGAYQETLGDLHNLFGDTNVVSIRVDSKGGVEYAREIEGDTVGDVLSYVEYDVKAIVSRIRNCAERAVRQGKMNARDRRNVMSAFEEGLRGYTYFER